MKYRITSLKAKNGDSLNLAAINTAEFDGAPGAQWYLIADQQGFISEQPWLLKIPRLFDGVNRRLHTGLCRT